MTEEIQRWTAKHKSPLGLKGFQAKITVSEASFQHDPRLSKTENCADDNAKTGIENALKNKPEGVREQYERQSKGWLNMKTPAEAYVLAA